MNYLPSLTLFLLLFFEAGGTKYVIKNWISKKKDIQSSGLIEAAKLSYRKGERVKQFGFYKGETEGIVIIQDLVFDGIQWVPGKSKSFYCPFFIDSETKNCTIYTDHCSAIENLDTIVSGFKNGDFDIPYIANPAPKGGNSGGDTQRGSVLPSTSSENNKENGDVSTQKQGIFRKIFPCF